MGLVDDPRAVRHAQAMSRPSPAQIPPDLRPRLEAARLDLLALFRALDRMDLTPAEIPSSLSGNCLSWMPIMWKRCGHWISHLIASTCIPCCTIPWPLLSNCPRLAPDSATLFHHVLTPPSVPWRRNFVIDSTQRKPTAWSPAAIPKTVKHPRSAHGSRP